MIKKISSLVLFINIILALLSPSLVQAKNELAVLESSAEVDFPLSLNFSLLAESNVSITNIRLHYYVERISHSQVTSEVYIEFMPSPMIDTSWYWDMRKTGGLPPGSSVYYWWTVEDSGGNKIETDPVRVQFNDNRYSWQELTEGEITIYWYEGGISFAEELMAKAQQAIIKLADDTGVYLEKPAQIYIYASAQDLRGAMINAQEWTGGVAFSRYGVIAIGISLDNLDWGAGAIAHELAHLVIHQLVLNPYSNLPTWLDEGLAMHAEGELQPLLKAYLEEAISESSLISARSLSSPFSAFTQQSGLSYAQSYSLVDFLITEYGQDKMLELLYTFRDGIGYDEALTKVYDFNTDELDALWREYVTEPISIKNMGALPALIGVLSALVAVLLLWLSLLLENWTWRHRNEKVVHHT